MEPTRVSRLTVVETDYHQQDGEQPISIESRFSRNLQTHDQSYIRKLVLGEEWKRLDSGWLDKIGMVTIQNQEGTSFQKIPTQEELARVKERIVEVSFDEGKTSHLVILPGESSRFQPVDISRICVRAVKGTRCTIAIFPS